MNRFAELREERTRVEFWIGSKNVHLREETKYDRKSLPRPHSREVIQLAIILASLVPPERQPLAIVSIARMMSQLFSWDLQDTLIELNVCLETWRQEGYTVNAWKDKAGLVHVELPKKMTEEDAR